MGRARGEGGEGVDEVNGFFSPLLWLLGKYWFLISKRGAVLDRLIKVSFDDE